MNKPSRATTLTVAAICALALIMTAAVTIAYRRPTCAELGGHIVKDRPRPIPTGKSIIWTRPTRCEIP